MITNHLVAGKAVEVGGNWSVFKEEIVYVTVPSVFLIYCVPTETRKITWQCVGVGVQCVP